MKRSYLIIGLAVSSLVFASLACSFAFSSAKVENVRLASDEAGSAPTTTFAQTDTFYLLGELNNAPDDTKLKTSWIAVEVEDTAADTLIDEAELTSGDGTFTFNLQNDQGLWPPGKYKVDLYLNDELEQTLEFQVERTAKAEIQNLRLASDPAGTQTGTTFPRSENVFVLGELANSPAGAEVKAVWSAVNIQTDQISDDTAQLSEGVIDEQAEQQQNGSFQFQLEKQVAFWPVGSYSVDMYLDGELVQTLAFELSRGEELAAENVRMASDQEGTNPTSVFSPPDVFYLVADIFNSPAEGAPVKVVWTTVKVEGAAENSEINTYEGTASDGSFWASLTSNEGAWSVGQYRAEFYLGGSLVNTLDFEVADSAQAQETPVPGAGAEIVGFYMARDDAGDNDTNVYAPGETFNIIGELINAPQGAQVEAVWMAEQVEGFASNDVISEPLTANVDEGPFSISLKSDSGVWTKGTYKVDLNLNGTLVDTRYFMVSDVKVIEPYMAIDSSGDKRTTIYGTQQKFYLLFTLGNAPADTKLSTKWYRLGEGDAEDESLNTSDYTFGTGEYYVELSSNSGTWEPGGYVVDIYLNDYFYVAVYFDVQ